MKNTLYRIILPCFILLLLFCGCDNGLMELNKVSNGTITVTVDTASRTLKPGGFANASVFNRIRIEFTQGDLLRVLTLENGATSGTVDLGNGTWNILAKAFVMIGGTEYEAANGTSSVTVPGTPTVNIELKTGIFSGAPGLFSYNFDLSQVMAQQAALELSPFGGGSGGVSIDLLMDTNTSVEIAPGYYMLAVSVKDASNKIAIWNEIVHIYSGQTTNAAYQFKPEDFHGTVTVSGKVFGGELDETRIWSARVTAYGDASFVTPISSFNINSFTKSASAPYYYSGDWEITIPASFAGKPVYFAVEENLSGPGGNSTYTWRYSENVSANNAENTGKEFYGSFTWWSWADGDLPQNTITYTVGQDGVVTITTNAVIQESWDKWKVKLGFNFPLDTSLRYAYEFEAWTADGDRDIQLQYIRDHEFYYYNSANFTITNQRKTYSFLQQENFPAAQDATVSFDIGSTETRGLMYIKLNKIVSRRDYTPPDQVGGQPRFTATPAANGIRLKFNTMELPYGVEQLQFYENSKDTCFTIGWYDDYSAVQELEFYEFIFPYVTAGTTYTFRVSTDAGEFHSEPVTATGGRGEFYIENNSSLAIVKEGNTLRLTSAPQISNFTTTNITDFRHQFTIVTGTSWDDLTAKWQYAKSADSPTEGYDLIEVLPYLESWVDPSQFLGRTCFSTYNYEFTYYDDDIYIAENDSYYYTNYYGTFSTTGVTSQPFTYPNAISDPVIFKAESHSEGIRLIFDLNELNYDQVSRIEGITLFTDESARLYIWNGQWNEGWGRFYNDWVIDVVYPFVVQGKTYTFTAELGGLGMNVEAAAVTAAAGLGELYMTNAEYVGLTYNSNTQTVGFTNTPQVSLSSATLNNPAIDDYYWRWQFFQGRNWDSQNSWIGAYGTNYGTLAPSPLVIDETLDPNIITALSGKTAFMDFDFMVTYDGFDYEAGYQIPISAPFTFPNFDPVVELGKIQLGGDINIYGIYYKNIPKGEPLIFSLSGDVWNSFESLTFVWFIDGERQNIETKKELVLYEWWSYDEKSGEWYMWYEYQEEIIASIPTDDLDAGPHYGLLMVTKNGTPYGVDFSFFVNE